MRSTSLRLPAALVEALKKHARQQGTSQADVIFDAIAANVEHLPELVRAELDRRKPAKDGLFIRVAPTEPMITIGLRAYRANIDTIDAIARKAGSVARSVVCAAALRAHLSHNRDQPGED